MHRHAIEKSDEMMTHIRERIGVNDVEIFVGKVCDSKCLPQRKRVIMFTKSLKPVRKAP